MDLAIERKKSITPNFGPTGKEVYERTYSRTMEDGSKEEWLDTVTRVVDGNLNFVDKKFWEEGEREELIDLMFDFKIIPAGRHLWATGARDGRQFIMNCFASETPVVTENGIFPIEKLTGETVNVLSEGGKYRKAEFKSYGEQKLYKVVFNNGDIIHATAEHEWLVKGKSERVHTIDLKGKRVPVNPAPRPVLNVDYQHGLDHGISYGIDSSDSVLPSTEKSRSYVYGFIVGIISIRGMFVENGLLIKVDSENVDDVRRMFTWVGFNTSPSIDSYVVIDPSCLVEQDLISARHLIHLKAQSSIGSDSLTVVDVVETDRVEEVYCCEEMETHTMAVGSNIITGQCWVAPWTDDVEEHFRFTFDQLMQGGGVGANYSNEYVEQYPLIENGIEFNINVMESHPDVEELSQTGFLSDESTDNVFVLPDTREGWVEGLAALVSAYYDPSVSDLTIDISKIRERGSIIHGLGGTASGPTPLVVLLGKVNNLLNERIGSKMTSADAMLIDHWIGEAVVSGNLRRSARMSIKSWQDEDIFNFIHCKEDHKEHWSTNISVEIDQDFFDAIARGDERAQKVYKAVVKSMTTHGEPGFFNRALAQEGEVDKVLATNPCVTGDTLIAVADGRGAVPIKELAEAGEDVPVYGVENDGKIVARMGRNPRRTAEDTEVVEVILDDGSSYRVTPNHKFVMRDGSKKAASDLEYGDSLTPIRRSRDKKPWGQSYWAMRNYSTDRFEHRVMADFIYSDMPKKELGKMVVHHDDRNGLNNSWDNLQLLTKEAHDHIHSKDMLGDKNPMRRAKYEWSEDKWAEYRYRHSDNNTGTANANFSGLSHDELFDKAVEFTKSLGRRASANEWASYASENGLPQSFSGWRFNHFNGGIVSFLKMAALKLGYDNIETDPRTLRRYESMLEMGYDCDVVDDVVIFHKNCEHCNLPFDTEYREVGLCSLVCSNKQKWNNGHGQKLAAAAKDNREEKRIAQVNAFNDLKINLGREPFKKEMQAHCKEIGLPFRVGGGKGNLKFTPTFESYKELKETAAQYNHRVISVKPAGRADVYNITVDEIHNYATVTQGEDGGYSGLLSVNCGEIVLQGGEYCCLGHVNIDLFYDDPEGLLEAHRLMSRFLLRATFSDIPNELSTEVGQKNRRIGVGHLGFQGWLVKQGIKFSESHKNDSVRSALDDMYKAVRQEAHKYSFEMRVPEPIKVTTVAPTGSVAKLNGRTEGMHPVLFKYFINNVRYSSIDPRQVQQVAEFEAKGNKVEDCIYSTNTKVVSFVAKNSLMDEVAVLGYDPDEIVEEAAEISFEDMLAVQAMYQKHYADNAVSFTINLPGIVNEDGTMKPIDITTEEVEESLLKYLPELKGTTIMIDGSRPQAPYMKLTKEEYEMMSGENSVIIDAVDLECASGACPIK